MATCPQQFPQAGVARPAAAAPARPYRGRFAPSPTGPLHRGSLVAALASWVDARAHGGTWTVRIEDIDPPRERVGAAAQQLRQLDRYGLIPDEAVVYQSRRDAAYRDALQRLEARGLTYVCRCSRTRLQAAAPEVGAPAYPGTCRERRWPLPGAVRFRVPDGRVDFDDRALGARSQDVARETGDFIVRRSDGLWAYQLAVVVDDAAQGITDVVRGADLLEATARQILLQRALGLPTPRYLHVPLVLDAHGRKISKRDAAAPLGAQSALAELRQAWSDLGFPALDAPGTAAFLDAAIEAWRRRYAGPRKSAGPLS